MNCKCKKLRSYKIDGLTYLFIEYKDIHSNEIGVEIWLDGEEIDFISDMELPLKSDFEAVNFFIENVIAIVC
jgi:hypothetical protein